MRKFGNEEEEGRICYILPRWDLLSAPSGLFFLMNDVELFRQLCNLIILV